MRYLKIEGKLLSSTDDAVRILIPPNWDVWVPRSAINPNGGLKINTQTQAVSAEVGAWKIEQLVREGKLPVSAKPIGIDVTADNEELEATDERFRRKGQAKT